MRKLCQIYPRILTILPLNSLFVSNLSKFYANLMLILYQNAFTKSIFLNMRLTPHHFWTLLKKLQDWTILTILRRTLILVFFVMLVRVTLVLMMALLCSKPEHELPHQPQFLPSPRNLSITGLLRWALFYFAAPYCPTSMARCLIFFLVLNRGGQLKTPHIFM